MPYLFWKKVSQVHQCSFVICIISNSILIGTITFFIILEKCTMALAEPTFLSLETSTTAIPPAKTIIIEE